MSDVASVEREAGVSWFRVERFGREAKASGGMPVSADSAPGGRF